MKHLAHAIRLFVICSIAFFSFGCSKKPLFDPLPSIVGKWHVIYIFEHENGDTYKRESLLNIRADNTLEIQGVHFLLEPKNSEEEWVQIHEEISLGFWNMSRYNENAERTFVFTIHKNIDASGFQPINTDTDVYRDKYAIKAITDDTLTYKATSTNRADIDVEQFPVYTASKIRDKNFALIEASTFKDIKKLVDIYDCPYAETIKAEIHNRMYLARAIGIMKLYTKPGKEAFFKVVNNSYALTRTATKRATGCDLTNDQAGLDRISSMLKVINDDLHNEDYLADLAYYKTFSDEDKETYSPPTPPDSAGMIKSLIDTAALILVKSRSDYEWSELSFATQGTPFREVLLQTPKAVISMDEVIELALYSNLNLEQSLSAIEDTSGNDIEKFGLWSEMHSDDISSWMDKLARAGFDGRVGPLTNPRSPVQILVRSTLDGKPTALGLFSNQRSSDQILVGGILDGKPTAFHFHLDRSDDKVAVHLNSSIESGKRLREILADLSN